VNPTVSGCQVTRKSIGERLVRPVVVSSAKRSKSPDLEVTPRSLPADSRWMTGYSEVTATRVRTTGLPTVGSSSLLGPTHRS